MQMHVVHGDAERAICLVDGAIGKYGQLLEGPAKTEIHVAAVNCKLCRQRGRGGNIFSFSQFAFHLPRTRPHTYLAANCAALGVGVVVLVVPTVLPRLRAVLCAVSLAPAPLPNALS